MSQRSHKKRASKTTRPKTKRIPFVGNVVVEEMPLLGKRANMLADRIFSAFDHGKPGTVEIPRRLLPAYEKVSDDLLGDRWRRINDLELALHNVGHLAQMIHSFDTLRDHEDEVFALTTAIQALIEKVKE